MSASTTTEAPVDSAFVCDCEEESRSACAREPFYQSHEGKRYCVLHFPGQEKSATFGELIKRRLSVGLFDFKGVWFPDKISFSGFLFDGRVDFARAVFNAETDFSKSAFRHVANFRFARFHAPVKFNSAVFSAYADFRDTAYDAEADFYDVSFKVNANFTRAVFSANAIFTNVVFARRAFFTNTTFNARAYFTSASFADRAYFMKTSIKTRAYFTYTSFESYVLFTGSQDMHTFTENTSLDFQFSRMEKPERVSFHTLTLRPHWFANIDTRKLDFINVDWRGSDIAQEVESLKGRKIASPHRMLAVVYRHLAVNAEENHRYEEASRFRYMAMDIRRQESWRGFAFWKLSWWYWLASGYGERILQAFVVLAGIWLISALLYTQVGFARPEPSLASVTDAAKIARDEVGTPLRWSRSLIYSLGVMTLQKPEPRPLTMAAQSLVLLETVLGPVQAALLALAIRRKFMR